MVNTMANTSMVKPGREGYKILFDTSTVIMNYKFAAAAAKYGTKENTLLKNIRSDFPGMKEVIVSGRVQTTAKANHRLTYENMEKHIRVYENAEDLTGKAVARQNPSFKDGRPKKFTPEQIDLALSLLEQGKTYRQIAVMTGISKSTLIRAKRVS